MATWVEDIIQALHNVGGRASLKQIYEEVERIRVDTLPSTWQASIRGCIERHSSDSEAFSGRDLFKKEGNGYWALREKPQSDYSTDKRQLKPDKEKIKMENQDLIVDDGLFIGQEIFKFSISESFENIDILFQTIKQYREYSNPEDSAWFDYIFEFFSLLGLNIEKLAPRLIGLHDIGTNKKPKALVCLVGPKENFSEIAYGIDWKSYLFFASKYYQIDWVILTNGLQFNVFNFAKELEDQKSFKCELDEIIKQGKTDSFITLFKVFSVITKSRTPQGTSGNATPGKKGKRIIVERHLIRKEFWTQLLANPKNLMTVFAKKKNPGIESYLMTPSGKKGIYFNYNISQNTARVQLYIDNGDFNWNKEVFDSIFENKSMIEQTFGAPLIWDRLENNRASLIRYTLEGTGLEDREKWSELQEAMIDTMINFEAALQSHISIIK